MSPLWIALSVGLVIVVAGVAFRHWKVRRRWKADRAQVQQVLTTERVELARRHPMQLRDTLRTLREVQSVHAAYAERPEIRERDRASTEIHLGRTAEAIRKIREAMEDAVKSRVDRGVVVPAMQGATYAATEGGSHEGV